MEQIRLICQYCSLPTSSLVLLQIIHASEPSYNISPPKHPFSALVNSALRKFFYGNCSSHSRKRTPQNRATASCDCSICNEFFFWISTVAGELLNCLAALGSLLELPPALLGLTLLAWGNSVGDLVADVALAKAGQPALAMAGCFACPMFNMLFGLGTALVIQTASVYPEAYELHFHLSITVAFVFLLLSLVGSLLVVTWCRFRVPIFWGFCLVGLYVVFIALSLLITKFAV